jgi:hypothetical protein
VRCKEERSSPSLKAPTGKNTHHFQAPSPAAGVKFKVECQSPKALSADDDKHAAATREPSLASNQVKDECVSPSPVTGRGLHASDRPPHFPASSASPNEGARSSSLAPPRDGRDRHRVTARPSAAAAGTGFSHQQTSPFMRVPPPAAAKNSSGDRAIPSSYTERDSQSRGLHNGM